MAVRARDAPVKVDARDGLARSYEGRRGLPRAADRRFRRNTADLSGRITSIADVFDALTHRRPYKAAWTIGAAGEEIRRQRELQFDPDVVDAFETLDPTKLLESVLPVDSRAHITANAEITR
jgi:hypothetical protein